MANTWNMFVKEVVTINDARDLIYEDEVGLNIHAGLPLR